MTDSVEISRCLVAVDIGYEANAAEMIYSVPNNLPARWRNLRVYVTDPMLDRDYGAIDTLTIPYEEHLEAGPSGGVFTVDISNPPTGVKLGICDLEDRAVIASNGYLPDAADARFHAQLVYSVAMATYEAFRSALGRVIGWRPANPKAPHRPLTLKPFVLDTQNAWYSRRDHSISFGFFSSVGTREIPEDRYVFSSLSSDIIVHETTHALLDSLKPYFLRPSNPDTLAFHEGFADIIAVLHRFGFESFVRSVIETDKFKFDAESLASRLGEQFSKAMGREGSLRDLSQPGVNRASIHARGQKLANSIFEAFAKVAMNKSKPIIRMATGKNILPDDEPVPILLLDHLAALLSRLAKQFRNICIRAIDYCPPVDIEFGDFLRAMITADTELVPNDDWSYREAIVESFRENDIYPYSVTTLSQTSLNWNGPQHCKDFKIEAFALENLRFRSDPGIPSRKEDIVVMAQILAAKIEQHPKLAAEIGLSKIQPGWVDPPEITSIRPARRGGPDGQIAFDLIAEVVQRGTVSLAGGKNLVVYGGATLIFGPDGTLRFVIRKRLDNEKWQRHQAQAIETGFQVFERPDGRLDYNSDFLQHVCRMG